MAKIKDAGRRRRPSRGPWTSISYHEGGVNGTAAHEGEGAGHKEYPIPDAEYTCRACRESKHGVSEVTDTMLVIVTHPALCSVWRFQYVRITHLLNAFRHEAPYVGVYKIERLYVQYVHKCIYKNIIIEIVLYDRVESTVFLWRPSTGKDIMSQNVTA